MKKLLLAFIGLAVIFAAVSCKPKKEVIKVDDINDEALYDEILGEFAQYYAASKAEKIDVNKRYALMAIAEAKLLESGVFLPIQSDGGNYSVSNAAPYSVSPVLWGQDEYKYHDAIVCTTAIKNADRTALKALWAEKKGTGTYAAEAIKYLQGKGYTVKDTYAVNYTSEPDSYDQLATSKAQNSKVTVNLCDGLLEYNNENEQVKKLADDLKVSEDGLTYTFTLKKGVNWTDSTGKVIGEVTADDFVAGFQHMLDDATGQLSWLVSGVVAGVDEYIEAKGDDFSIVGVKAPDTYTVEYKLAAPCSYFLSMFSYTLFNPLNRAYYVSQGGVFGFGKYAAAEGYEYAKDYEHLAYCGPYLVKSHTDNNEWTFVANDKYYDAANVRIKEIKWVYANAKVATAAYENYKAGSVDGTGLNAAALALAKADGIFDDYCYVASTGSASYPGFLNLYRRAYANYDDPSAAVTDIYTNAQANATNKAMANKNFRLALLRGIDRASYMAQSVGEDLKYASMTNSYTPGNFVKLDAAVEVEINGVKKQFPAGTYYGEIMQAQISADGYSMKVWDPQGDGGVGASTGYDGWYDAAESKKLIDKAVEELKAEGLEISAKNPIKVEFVFCDDGSTKTAQAKALKNSVEASTGGLIEIVLNGVDADPYYSANYYFDLGKEANYNINTLSGWGPDYGDPSSYLDTMYKGGGYMIKCLGLDC